MVLIRCQLVVLDAGAFPALVEARFHDADGRLVRVVDKEPIFAGDDDPPGQGWVGGTELRREGGGAEARVWVSLASPWSLVTTDGEETVAVWARDVTVSTRG